MKAFFVKTEPTSAGPFTGVELREAALAGIVGPDTPIAAGPNGPWTKAEHAGLFSEKRLPLPHPPGTPVPQYRVRGMQGSVSGPFKLRELIGFAARGMLPVDVQLKSNVSQQWIPLQRIPVLVACLSGQLVLLGESGKASTAAATPGRRVNRAAAKAAKSIDITQSSVHWRGDVQPKPELLLVGQQGLVIDEAEAENEIDPRTAPDHVDSDGGDADSDGGDADSDGGERPRRRFSLPSFPSFQLRLPGVIHPRLLVNALCLLLALAGIGAAYSYWRSMGMSADQIVGDWVGGGDGAAAVGISFRENLNCVIFNTQGESWSGDYMWAARTDDGQGFDQIDPFSSQVDKLDALYQSGPVRLTDGYIRLRGFVDEPPLIAGHRIADCFLRRNGENLQLGYLTNVSWTRTSRTMEAGWIELRPLRANRDAEILAELKSMEVEPRPVKGYSVEKSPHLSEAITALQNSQQADALDGDVGNGSVCYSVRVNAEYLLRTYGMPDEARPVYPFEIPQLSIGQSFEGSQVVRYGVLKLILRSDGTIQYVSIML